VAVRLAWSAGGADWVDDWCAQPQAYRGMVVILTLVRTTGSRIGLRGMYHHSGAK
jgi:hypothetical protein